MKVALGVHRLFAALSTSRIQNLQRINEGAIELKELRISSYTAKGLEE